MRQGSFESVPEISLPPCRYNKRFSLCRKVNEFKKKIALVEGKRKVTNVKFKF
jgi:hypothetical protein